MEVFNIVKIILVLVLFGYSVWELVNKLKKQQKQIQNLNKVVSNIRSNDIIYVEPSYRPLSAALTAASQVLGLVSSILLSVIVLNNFNNRI